MKGLLIVALLSVLSQVRAGEVEIVKVRLQQQANAWLAQVTLRHADTGWEHYADGWRVVTREDKLLGHRTLHHPHVNEQPFTRSLSGIAIPASVQQVVVKAHDKVHGWSEDEVRIDLQRERGERYQIDRR